MKIGQKLTYNGIQCAGFPMEYLNITQGCNGVFSHNGVPGALDLAGKDTGIDETIAPCDMHLVAYDSQANGNAVFFQSDNKVLLADGTKDYVTMMFIHDNYIGDILARFRSGKGWKMGEPFGDEGVAGYATGNHCHMEAAKGKFVKCYQMNAQGTWQLYGSTKPDKLFFIDGTKLINNGQPSGSGDKMNWKKVEDVYGGATNEEKTEVGGKVFMCQTFQIKGGSSIYYVDIQAKNIIEFNSIRECQFIQNLYKANQGKDIPHKIYKSASDEEFKAMLAVCKKVGIKIPEKFV